MDVFKCLKKSEASEVDDSCQPWAVSIIAVSVPMRGSTNEERLDGENGLLMTPSMDLSSGIFPGAQTVTGSTTR
jgi:hypothetical protein